VISCGREFPMPCHFCLAITIAVGTFDDGVGQVSGTWRASRLDSLTALPVLGISKNQKRTRSTAPIPEH
jgi:hypothetical protein